MTQNATRTNPLPTTRAPGLMLALEPRFMFDAAGAATGADIAVEQAAQQLVDQAIPPTMEIQAQDASVADKPVNENSGTIGVDSSSAGSAIQTISATEQLANAFSNYQPSANDRQAFVFVDTRVADYQSLLAGVNPGAQVVLLDSNRDGIAQIAEILAGHQQVDAIHLISHGSAGQISLGSALLNAESMSGQYAEALRSIGSVLSADADILIYGCDFAAGSDGLQAVNQLAQLTGADVAASSDYTGAAALGGDWNLEVQSGVIDSNLAFSAAALTAFDGLLVDPVPEVTISGSSNVFIGNDFTFTATFDNTSATEVGYAPYIDLLFPRTGKDGAGSQDAAGDGINFVSASYLGSPVTAYTVTFDGSGNATHPLAKDSTGAFRVITAVSYGLQAGDKLVVLELPFGSVTGAQPTIPVVVTAHLSNLADVGVGKDLVISARAGFRFGKDALDNPTSPDPSIQQATAPTFNVHPTLVTMTQSFTGPEQDTATGPNYVRQLSSTATPAVGQTLTNFDVSQTLPDTVVVKAITPGAGGTVTSIILRDNTVITNAGTITSTLAAGTFLQSYTVRYTSLLSAAKTTTVDFYVPLNDYANAPILDAITGNDRTITIAAATGNGSWTPVDSRDAVTTVTTIANGGTATTFDAKSIAIQKSVTIQTDTGSTGTTPGDKLEYNLQVDVSDYFAFGRDSGGTGSWLVDDVLGDGQTWDNTFTPTLTYTDSTGSHSVALTRTTHFTVGNSFGDDSGNKDTTVGNIGKTYLRFDLDAALTRLAGDLHGGSTANGASQATIKLRSTVDDSYTTVYTQSFLNEGDSVTNNVTTIGDLLNASLALTGNNEDDGSSASSTIAKNSVTTTIVGYNDGTAHTGAPSFLKPSDTVTINLKYNLATGDYENFKLNSFLPLPVLTTNDSNADGTPGDAWTAGGTWNGAAGTLPAVGQWMYGTTHSTGLNTTGNPTANGVANSLTFDFGSNSNPGNDPKIIEVLYTIKVSNQPFADQLFLTLLAESSHKDTVASAPSTMTSAALINIQLAEPEVTIKTGVVRVSNSDAIITGTTGTWAATTDIVSVPFTAPITSASAVNGNLTNFDGGDFIRLATAIENTGGSAAFDVTTTIATPPAGLDFVGSSLSAANLKVFRGNGTLLEAGATKDYLISGNTITFLDKGGIATLGVGRNGTTAVTDGSNVIVITYDVNTNATVDASQNFTTTATLTNYAGTDGGPDFIPIGADIVDTATQVVAAPAVTKVFQGGTISNDDSSVTNTNGSSVVIGESMIYDIIVTLPEGETQSLLLDDLVPAGMRLDTTFNGSTGYELITNAAASGGSLSVSFGGSVSVGSFAATPSGTLGVDGVDGRFTFATTTTNTPNGLSNNDSFVVRVRLIADNVIGNQAATTLDASAQLVYNDVDGDGSAGSSDPNSTVARTGAAPLVTVSEPSLSIVKTVDTDVITAGIQSAPVDAGDVVEYTITVSNPSGGANVNAYDLIFGDAFPSQLSAITIQSAEQGTTGFALGTGTNLMTGTAQFEVLGNTVQTLNGTGGSGSFNLDLAPGESIVLVVRGTVNVTAPSVASFDSNSVVRWSSINSANNLPASQDTDERTGADGVGSGLNNYAVQDNALVNVVPLAPSLSHIGGLPDTAAPSPTTAVEEVAIGEIIRYRGVVRIPEGYISDFNIQAILSSSDLSYINDGTTKIAFISSNGSGITSNIALTSIGTLGIVGTEATGVAGNIPADLSNGPTAVLVSAGNINTSNAQAPVFSFGNLTNSDSDADAEYVVVEFNVRVNNTNGNDTADSRSVSFKARTGSSDLGTSNTVVEDIVEPQITNLTKAITAFDPNIGSGKGRATLTLNFTNTGDGTANDVHLIDSITSGSNYSITGVTIGGTPVTIGTSGVTATTTGGITVDFTQLAVGTAVSIVYTVDVPNSAAIVSSNATITYSGLPETFITFAGSTVGGDTTPSGERDGSGGTTAPNNYQDTDGAGLGIISGTLWDDTNDFDGNVDSGENRLSGQTVTLVWAGADGNLDTGDDLSFTTTTDSSGNYHFGALPVGNYRITGANSGGTITVSGDTLKPRFDNDASTPLGQIDLAIGEGAAGEANIGYVQLNNAPVNTVPGAQQTTLEDTPLIFSSANSNAITVADADAGSNLMTLQLIVSNGRLNLTLAGGAIVSLGQLNSATVTLFGSQTDINNSLASLTYTPNAQYNGSDTLTVRSNDRGNTGDHPTTGDGIPNQLADSLSDTDTVSINITAVNDAPAGTNKTVLNHPEDTPFIFNASDFGFTDPNDNPANTFQSVIITTLPPPNEGKLFLNNIEVNQGQNIPVGQIGNLEFRPTLNLTGSGKGAFTFQVVDNGGTANNGQDTDQSPNTFAFNIGTTNDAPVNTVPAAQTTLEDTPLVFMPGNGNAISVADVDSPTLTVTLTVTNGTLTLNGATALTFSTGDGTADGTMTFSGSPADINAALNGLSFIPLADFNGGPFNLTITTFDGTLTNIDTVAITVTPVADAVNDILITPQNTAISYNPIIGTNGANVDNFEGGSPQITAINGTPITEGGSVAVTNGSVSLGAGNVLTFTPAAGFHGAVPTFTYTVNSGGLTETANIDITVNSPPQALDDNGSGRQSLPIAGTLLANDTDIDNNPLTISSFTIVGVPGVFAPGTTATIPGVGTLVINATGQYTFTPLPSFFGAAPVVTYTITDGQGGFSSAALNLVVEREDSVAPDNLWNAGRSFTGLGFTDPSVLLNPPAVDMELKPILPVISAVTDADDLNGITAVGDRATHPVLQTVQRIGNLQFLSDRLNGLLGKFTINRGVQANRPISQEIDRIEHQFMFDDVVQRTTSNGRSSWDVGGLRHSVTMTPRGESNGSHDFLTVHTTLSGALLYVELEHTVEKQPHYDIERFSARLADGRPLPGWLSFDPGSGVVSGVPPAGGDIIKLQVATELKDGRVLSSYVEIEPNTGRIVELKPLNPSRSTARFTDQVAQSAGRFNDELTHLRNTLGR